MFTGWAREYGDIVSWRTFHYRIYLLNHPDDIETILVTRSRSFHKGRGLQANRELFGNGLLLSEGDFWLRQRRLMQPAFSRERISTYAASMATHAAHMLAGWRDGETIDVHRELMRVALEIAGETLFGVSVGHEAERVSAALRTLVEANTTAWRLMPLLRSLPTASNRRYSHAVAELHSVVASIIARRHASSPAKQAARDDLLARLLSAEDADGSRMNDTQLRDECVTLLLAGHETTALALTWTAYLLARHPDLQERFYLEAHSVLGDRTPAPEDLQHMPFCDCVIRESLRLYPPAWLMPRLTIEDCEIRGYKIACGASVLVSPYVVHRDARYFSEPDRFHPDRWSEAFARSLPRFAYFPFGGGPRICIGNHFALLEAGLLLTMIIQRFRLEPADSAEIEPLPSITLRPKGPVRLKISRRSSPRYQTLP